MNRTPWKEVDGNRSKIHISYMLPLWFSEEDSEKHSVSPSEHFGDSSMAANLAKPDCNSLGFSKSSEEGESLRQSFQMQKL